jgi:hypothetical protein
VDATEKSLTDAYHAAVDEMKKYPNNKSAPIRVQARVSSAYRKLKAYQRKHKAR